MKANLAALVVAVAAVSASPVPAQAPPQGASQAPGLDLAGMDRSVRPGDNFFAYANGTWLKTTEIPVDRSSWGVGAELVEETNARVAELIKGAGGAAGSEPRKVSDYYAAYLDQARIDARGLSPIKPTLNRIAAISTRTELAKEFGLELRTDVDALNNTNFHTANVFGLWIEQDLNDPKRYAPYLLQGGLGLPDRSYYLSDSPHMQAIRTAYKAHLVEVLKLAGISDPDGRAKRIFDLETKIAKVHVGRAESEDVQKANNPWRRSQFATKAPGLDWTAFFTAAGLQAQPRFVVWHPGAVAGEAALAKAEPLSVWKDYLALHQIEAAAEVLPHAFGDARFTFYGKTLMGTPQQPARWKQSVVATNDALGEAVGKLYVAKYFPPASKAAVQVMVDQLLTAFRARIQKLDWMAPATKAEALRKLQTLKVGVGYPDHWISYEGLTVTPGDAFGNLQRARLFDYRRNLAKLGRPVDRGEWSMTPQTVDAVNLPIKNALNFPAAILQAPSFDPRNPVAMNLGGTGATIGHEISHSFDDQGAQFDADGRFRDWWTPADLAHFKASGAALAAQFSAYHPFADLALNGEQVLSENIADLAGLNAAYDAYRASYGDKPAPDLQGFSGDQQFFLAFAQRWRSKIRESALRQRVATDGHAPAEFRADTVRNLDAWYGAFDVKPGEGLYLAPEARVRVW